MENPRHLTSVQAKELLSQFGANALPEQKPPGRIEIFFSQLSNPLVFILLFAVGITFLLKEFADSAIILFTVLVNAILGYFQENRANQALLALKKLVTQESEVLRDGKRLRIDTRLIVPGDVVFLGQGEKVPADGVLLALNRLHLNEAMVTGESVPVDKVENDEVFMGTIVVSGQATLRVTHTGSNTKIGGIAQKIQSPQEITPLGRQLKILSQKILFLALILALVVFLIGLYRGIPAFEMFVTVVALTVSVIPEGLLISLTVVLAIGMQKILRRKGLVRKLASAETLGSVTTICIDKTGTLTNGALQVSEVVGDEKEIARQVLVANDLDDPLVVALFEWGQKIFPNASQKHERIDSIPFSSQERFFTSLNVWDDKDRMILVNGAPDILLPWTTLSKKEKHEVMQEIDALTSEGKRIIGFARKKANSNKSRLNVRDVKSELEWVGMVALSDTIRPSVKDALNLATAAGIKILVITGDYAKTSEYVLAELGRPVRADQVMTGEELEQISLDELKKKLKVVQLFARTTPEQKLKIVQALKENGEIVAMMGDGVNDAPAIHRSDIGIVVDEASDVARESADLVLMDSNFSTIVAAIEEGRGIFENLRKIILYLLCGAFSEVFIVISSLLLGLPLPIITVQIVWINLVSDGLPSLALTVDPQRAGVMNERPRDPKEQLVTPWMLGLITLIFLVAGITSLMVFVFSYFQTGDVYFARSLTFAVLGMSSLMYVFSVRTLLSPFWKNNVFVNPWLNVSVLAGVLLQMLPFATPLTREFFGVVPLTLEHWILAFVLSIMLFFTVEIFKWIMPWLYAKRKVV